ncbi:hypothetical protein CP533_4860 [Ophiocordyceps camponoti-saundersi (nom. inval.)]|nr:hypothetical protein CP533_4860 [Ophiocordyceps camponoti-saundersi (nom. inval.)]
MASSPVEPELLTPKSKIRALLATVDSDDEANSPTKAGSVADELESRPRGKLASRMQGDSGAVQGGPKRSDATAGDAVGEFEGVDRPDNDGEEDAEDDDLPVMSRRVRRRLATAPVDDTELPVRTPSPGLFVSSPPRPSPQNGDSDSDADLPAVASERFKALLERKKQERLAREAESQARSEQVALDIESEAEDSGITDDEGGRRLTQKARPARKASKKAVEEMNRETQRMARNMQLAHEAKTRKKLSTASLLERFNYRPNNAGPQTQSSSRPASPQSDLEARKTVTPPSSPPARNPLETQANMDQSDDEELPSVEQIADKPRIDKGKGKAIAPEAETMKRRIRVRLPAVTLNTSDDELQVTYTRKNTVDAVLDKLPVHKKQESRPLRALRALAQVKSPGKQKHMTAGELDAQLQRRAREQARLERERRLEALKAQGVVMQTAEERERQEQEVEDLVARAREEANKLRRMERAAAEDGDEDDSEEDGDFGDAAQEADGEASELDLSGSEEEGEQEEEEEGEEDEEEDGDEDEEQQEADDLEQSVDETVTNPFLDRDAVSEDEEDVKQTPAGGHRRPRRHKTVLSDDEAEVKATPCSKTTEEKTGSPTCPTSVLRSAKKTFIPGLAVQGPAGLGLTQMFAGTMGEEVEAGDEPTQSMMPDFDNFPDSNFSATAEVEEEMIMDSQPEVTASLNVKLNLSQSQMHGFDSFPTQATDMTMEPTQDVGLQIHTPIKERFVEEQPVSTNDTEPAQSPLVRRGRLRRKADSDALSLLVEGARKQKRVLDRKKTKAREMVEEQAQESEDEFAGLGGADGEDSDEESTASLQEIIDDDHEDDGDESKLAAFYADRARAEDEKQVEKLFKDITTGMLRRKRGTGYNLDDSDSSDSGTAARKMKRRRFEKMQKTLYADERVRKIADDVENVAFLRTLHDLLDEEDGDLLHGLVGERVRETGERVEEEKMKGKGMGERKRKRKRDEAVSPGKVRETLSTLLDDDTPPSQESASEEEHDPLPLPPAPPSKPPHRRSQPNSHPTTVKVPTLLRRATTNSSLTFSASTLPSQEQTKIRRGPVRASVSVAATASSSSSSSSASSAKTQGREGKKVRDLARMRIGVVGAFLGRGVFE